MGSRKRFVHQPVESQELPPVDARNLKRLKRAHQMLENGKHSGAAALFEALAHTGQDRNFRHQAPHLYLQAARASFLAGIPEIGFQQLNQGLSIFVGAKRWPSLAKAGRRIVEDLNQIGYPEYANRVLAWLGIILPEPLESYSQGASILKRSQFKCLTCGGVMRPDEIELLEEDIGECLYCGSLLQGE